MRRRLRVDHLNYLDTMDYVERDLYDEALVIVTDIANINVLMGLTTKWQNNG